MKDTGFTLVRSLPLEGSQLGQVQALGADLQVRSLPLEGSQRGINGAKAVRNWFAHYPWRDRNSPLPVSTASPSCSLITPGGIATGQRGGDLLRNLPRFAHYPWRDRNVPG